MLNIDLKVADQDQILEDLRGLLQINSTTGDAGAVTQEAPLGENINNAINYVLDLGKSFGFKTKNLDGYSGWIEIGPEDAEELIGILVHVDTVPVGDDWDYEPFDLTIYNGNMYGRGTNDDKGPAIAALYALKAISDSEIPLTRKVRLIVGGDEENGNWSCMTRYKETEQLPTYAFSPDACYPVIYAEKGILHIKFVSTNPDGDAILLDSGTVPNIVPDKAHAEYNGKEYDTTGIASHAMEPEKGENALLKLGQLLKEEGANHTFLDLLEIANTDGLNISLSDEPSGKLTFNPAVGHVDENEAYLISDIRYPVTLNSEDILERMRESIAPLGYELELLDDVAPLYVDKNSDFVKTLVEVYNEYTGDEAEPIALGGGTYARAFDNAVAFGILFPGEPDMCHKRNEYWPVEDLMKNVEIIAQATAALASENN